MGKEYKFDKDIHLNLNHAWAWATENKDTFLEELSKSQADYSKKFARTIFAKARKTKIPVINEDLFLHFNQIKIIPKFLLSLPALPSLTLEQIDLLPKETQDILFSFGACSTCHTERRIQKFMSNQCEEIFEKDELKKQQCQQIYDELQNSLKKAGCKCKHKGIKNKYAHKFTKLIEQ